ncbi:MAG: ABC transporter permease, partial [Actinomycetota bacterium]
VTAPVAYLTSRFAGKITSAISAVIIAGFAIPGLAVALALAHWTVRAPGIFRGLYQSFALLIFAYVVHFGAQALRGSQVAFGTITNQMREAATVLGAPATRRMLSVELPLAAPGMLAAAGLVFMSTVKELPATLLLAPAGFQTLATRIWSATEDAFLADASLAALTLVALSGFLTWLLVIRPEAKSL